MNYKTERKIINYVNLRLRRKYPTIVKTYMQDVHSEYDKIMKAYSIQKILKPAAGDFVPPRVDFAFRFSGRTKNYKQFLRRRETLRKILVIPYPFIRCILNYAKTDFPDALSNYGVYRHNAKGKEQWLMLSDFGEMAAKDLEDNVMFLKKDWYPKIVKIMKKHYRRHAVPRHLWPRIFNCAKGLIARQITELKIRTFQHIFDVLMDKARMPYFKLQAICTNYNIELFPTFEEIYETFNGIFKGIAKVGENLPMLELQIDPQEYLHTDNFLNVKLPDVFMKDVQKQLRQKLADSYAPLIDYLQDFRSEYYGLYGEQTKLDLRQFLSEPRSFDEYLNKIDIFHEYINILRLRVQNEYFDTTTINQSKAIIGLRTFAQDYIKEITANIVVAHKKDCQNICHLFAVIKDKATEVPITTEMLLANGEYMLEVKTKQMFALQARIQESLRVRNG